MKLILFEDSANEARTMAHWFGALKGQYLGLGKLDIEVASGDWWEFVESRTFPGEDIQEPAERAKSTALPAPPRPQSEWAQVAANIEAWLRRRLRFGQRSKAGQYWLLDLHLANADPAGTAKLNAYLEARCKEIEPLQALVNAARANPKVHWDDIKHGVAIAAYAKQHHIPKRFVSELAAAEIAAQQNLLSWLAVNEPVASDEKPFFFRKPLLAVQDLIDLNDAEDAEYGRVFSWIARGGRLIRTSRDPRYFMTVGPIKITQQQWEIGSWVVGIVLAVALTWVGIYFSRSD